MQPRVVLLGQRRDPRQRIDRRRAGRPDRRHDRRWPAPGRPVGLDRPLQLREVERVLGVGGDEPQVRPAEARQERRLLDRAVPLLGGVHDERRSARLQARGLLAEPRCLLARTQERAERRSAGGVVDDARPGGREPHHLAEPVHHYLFDFGRGGRRLPAHPLHAEPGGEDVCEDRRIRRVRGEVGKEGRMIPVRDPAEDVLLQQCERLGEVPAVRRR